VALEKLVSLQTSVVDGVEAGKHVEKHGITYHNENNLSGETSKIEET
jgi:hypothetical protein